MRKLTFSAAVFLLIAPFATNAAIIEMELSDLLIGGTLYDVTLFQDDDGFTSFNAVYGASESPFLTFTSEGEATAAAQAIFDYAVAQAIDLSPFSSLNAAVVPFSVNADYVLGYMVAYVSQGQLTGPFGAETDNYRRDREGFGSSFAKFTVAPVPEPGTLALLGLGLAGLGLSGRRKA